MTCTCSEGIMTCLHSYAEESESGSEFEGEEEQEEDVKGWEHLQAAALT
jgi:hypothetical protein